MKPQATILLQLGGGIFTLYVEPERRWIGRLTSIVSWWGKYFNEDQIRIETPLGMKLAERGQRCWHVILIRKSEKDVCWTRENKYEMKKKRHGSH